MFGLFESVTSLVKDVATIAVAPVEIAVDLAGAVVKPVADAAKEIASDIKSIKE